MRMFLRKALCIHLSVALTLMGTGCAGIERTDADSDQEVVSMQEPTAVPEQTDVEDGEAPVELIEVSDTPASELSFSGISDPAYIQYTQDALLSDLELELLDDDIEVEEVYSVYLSKEYLEELEYNSLANIYFGYSLADIEEQFEGEKYIFTLGDDGHTVVSSFEGYDDSFNTVVKNTAIGGGVILTLVVLSVAAPAVGVPAKAVAVLVSSAKGASIGAASIGILSGAISGFATGFETGDMEAAFEAAALSGSEGFKWGAIVGGAAGATWELFGNIVSARSIPDCKQSEADILAFLGGRGQVAYRNGEEVSVATLGSTRPDIVTTIGGEQVAVEVKNYDLVNNLRGLANVLREQIAQRAENLPDGMRQMIYLDVRNRGYSQEFLNFVLLYLQQELDGIGGGVPIVLYQ